MENCTIYSHQLAFDKVIEIVKRELPKAKIQANDNGMQKGLVATLKGGFFSKDKELKINYRQRERPSHELKGVECGLTQNLAGMLGFVQKIPAQNESVRDQLLYKISSINTEMPFMATPTLIPEFQKVLSKIIHELDAIVFSNPTPFFSKSSGSHFVDKNFNLIFDQGGACEIDELKVLVDAKYKDGPSNLYTDEQNVRKQKSEAYISPYGVKINKNLPAVENEAAVVLRSKEEVIDRTYCLMVTAARGEGVNRQDMQHFISTKKVVGFSPNEQRLNQIDELIEQDKVTATWRYESLAVLLWALGHLPELTYPDNICDVPRIAQIMSKTERADFEQQAVLRSTAEILDELDKIYRMHWACVDARIKGQPVGGGLQASVVYERHYALNWLVRDQESDWDDVVTHT